MTKRSSSRETSATDSIDCRTLHALGRDSPEIAVSRIRGVGNSRPRRMRSRPLSRWWKEFFQMSKWEKTDRFPRFPRSPRRSLFHWDAVTVVLIEVVDPTKKASDTRRPWKRFDICDVESATVIASQFHRSFETELATRLGLESSQGWMGLVAHLPDCLWVDVL